MKLNSCSTRFQGKRKKATEQGDSAFFGNKTQHEGSTASWTEEQIRDYKTWLYGDFGQNAGKLVLLKLYFEAIDRSYSGTGGTEKRQLGKID